MAEKSLRLIFENAMDTTKEVSITVPRCDDTKAGSVVRAAMDAISLNAEVFQIAIGNVKAAKFITPAVYTPVVLS